MTLRHVPGRRIGLAHAFETPCGQGAVQDCDKCGMGAKTGLLIETGAGPFRVLCLGCVAGVWTAAKPEGDPVTWMLGGGPEVEQG